MFIQSTFSDVVDEIIRKLSDYFKLFVCMVLLSMTYKNVKLKFILGTKKIGTHETSLMSVIPTLLPGGLLNDQEHLCSPVSK